MKRREKLEEITPNRAKQLMKHNTFKGQRPIRASEVDRLSTKMLDGRFHVGLIGVLHQGPVTELINGQHQCQSAIDTEKSFKAVVVDYTVEPGDTEDDIASVFAQFNDDRAKSKSDIAWAYGARIGMADWPHKCVRLCASALAWGDGGMPDGRGGPFSKEDAAALLGRNKEACAFVHEILFKDQQASKIKHLLRAPVIAAMIHTWRRNRGDAEVFWLAVRDGDQLKADDPAFLLREHLLRSVLRVATNTANKKAASQRELYAKGIMAWNAYRSGGKTQLRYSAKHDLPQVK